MATKSNESDTEPSYINKLPRLLAKHGNVPDAMAEWREMQEEEQSNE